MRRLAGTTLFVLCVVFLCFVSLKLFTAAFSRTHACFGPRTFNHVSRMALFCALFRALLNTCGCCLQTVVYVCAFRRQTGASRPLRPPHSREVVRKNWNDTKKISMASSLSGGHPQKLERYSDEPAAQ